MLIRRADPRQVIASAVLVCLVLSGCTFPRVPLLMYRPEVSGEKDSLTAVLVEPTDARTNYKLDEALRDDLMELITEAIASEARSSGSFRTITTHPPFALNEGELKAAGVDILIVPTVVRLEAEIPNYGEDEVAQAMFVLGVAGGLGGGLVGVAAGGAAGLMYGSMPTDVSGYAKLNVTLKRLASGQSSSEVYAGGASERMSKLSADMPEARSRLAGKALSHALDQLRVDLRSSLPN